MHVVNMIMFVCSMQRLKKEDAEKDADNADGVRILFLVQPDW